jgi:hypothetical protein
VPDPQRYARCRWADVHLVYPSDPFRIDTMYPINMLRNMAINWYVTRGVERGEELIEDEGVQEWSSKYSIVV